MAVKLDRRNIDRFAEKLAREAPKRAQEISARSINRSAKAAELFSKKTVKANMRIRNKWTIGSIRSTRTFASRKIDRQFALVGSKQEYMATQEYGGALPRKDGARRLTTAKGSREGATAYPRKKLARGRMATRNIRLNPRRGGRTGSPGRRAKRAVESARNKRERFVYLNLGGDRKGIFEVQRKRIWMVHRIFDRRLRVKPQRWLRTSVTKTKRIMPKIFLQEMKRGVISPT